MAFSSIIHRGHASIFPVAIHDTDLIRVLESMIDSEKQRVYVQGIPDVFPFEIEYTHLITLRREYRDEIITITESTLNYRNRQDKESSFPPRLHLYVEISKSAVGVLQFSVNTSPHEFAIDSVSLFKYDGPNGLHELNDLNENLHKAWLKSLKIRGIKLSIANFFVEFAQRIEDQDIQLLLLLKQIKDFVEH